VRNVVSSTQGALKKRTTQAGGSGAVEPRVSLF